MLAEPVSSNELVPTTSTVSVASPRERLKSTCCNCPAVNVTSLLLAVLKPAAVEVTVYVPGFSAANVYVPEPFVLTVAVKWVEFSTAVTTAFGTFAPVASFTSPWMLPRYRCATAETVKPKLSVRSIPKLMTRLRKRVLYTRTSKKYEANTINIHGATSLNGGSPSDPGHSRVAF